MEKTFVADVHLGKLARWLRLLGFDTAYRNDYSMAELIGAAREEDRVLLSRNAALAKNKSFESLIISYEEPVKQLQQVVDHFQIRESIHLFTRCMVCNGLLEEIPKKEIVNKLEPNTARFYHEFWRCCNCHRLYWKGAHYQRMQQRLRDSGF